MKPPSNICTPTDECYTEWSINYLYGKVALDAYIIFALV